MRKRITTLITALLVAAFPMSAHATEPEIPDVIKEAYAPGSDLYNNAIELLEYQNSITASEAEKLLSTTAQRSANTNAAPVVTYGQPIRTAYFGTIETGTGPIVGSNFYELPDRYIAVQYVNNSPVGTFTVDVNGDFVEMGTKDEDTIKSLENWPHDGSIYATGTALNIGVAVSPDGKTITPVGIDAYSAIGKEPLTTEKFRKLAAQRTDENNKANDPKFNGGEYVTSGTTSTNETTSPIPPLVLAGTGAVIVFAAAFLLGRFGARKHKPQADPV